MRAACVACSAAKVHPSIGAAIHRSMGDYLPIARLPEGLLTNGLSAGGAIVMLTPRRRA
jgi:hypothetical protein